MMPLLCVRLDEGSKGCWDGTASNIADQPFMVESRPSAEKVNYRSNVAGTMCYG